MISRRFRFRGHASLARLYQKSRSVRVASMTLRYAPNSRADSFRAAVVVSKKVSKSAVVRNRIRRRIYEQIRLISPEINQPTDMIITVYEQAVAEMPADKLQNDVRQLIQAARLIH